MQVRDKLSVEVTRKQFLQYLAGAVLMVFGIDNLIALLTGNHPILHRMSTPASTTEGFGARRFGD